MRKLLSTQVEQLETIWRNASSSMHAPSVREMDALRAFLDVRNRRLAELDSRLRGRGIDCVRVTAGIYEKAAVENWTSDDLKFVFKLCFSTPRLDPVLDKTLSYLSLSECVPLIPGSPFASPALTIRKGRGPLETAAKVLSSKALPTLLFAECLSGKLAKDKDDGVELCLRIPHLHLSRTTIFRELAKG